MAKKIKKGGPLEELVKGSMDYTMQLIRDAFRKQFSNDGMMDFYMNEIFSDHVIVSDWSNPSTLKTDEYWKVTYTKADASSAPDGSAQREYVFAARDAWEIVELAYQPQSAISDQQSAVSEKKEERGKKKGKRFNETITNAMQFVESSDGEKADGPWRVKATGITADIINGNGRRYPAKVLEAAVKELKGHLHESAAQGRMLSLTGESDHPADKGNRRSLLSEVVFNWDKVDFDGQHVLVEGNLLGTSKGKDIRAQMLGGVIPGISQRGYGASKSIKEREVSIEEVTQLIITGYDGTAPNEQSDPNGSINYFESQSSEDEMNEILEQLKKLLAENPELFGKGMTEAQLETLNEKQLKKLDESLRTALGIDANTNIIEAVKANADKAKLYDAMQAKAAVDAAITEATKDLPFGKKLNEMFIESLNEAELATPEAVKKFAESKRKEYGKLASKEVLEGMGFKGQGRGITGIADVLEKETGTPEFARASFEIAESFRRRNGLIRPNLKEPVTPNEIYTKMVLERFDKLYMRIVDDHQNVGGLLIESQRFEEAELTTDLNLPTSVSRAIFDIVGPTLVAASIFDVGVIDQSPTRLNFKRFTGETGYAVDVTDEVVTGGAEGTWYALDFGRVTPDSVTVTSNPAGTTYVEGTDYVIDYAAGRIKFLTAGNIGTDDVLVDYSYTAIRKGEMAPIERAKVTIDSMIITAAADRLADQISREAIVFGRSQLGYDAVTETMAALVQETRRIIDQGLLYAAYSAVKAVANNSTAAWTRGNTQDDLDELVRLMGAAGIIIDNRYYPADFYLASNVNAEQLSHWQAGFKRDGFPNAVLNAAGFAGGVNNKPIFSSTEFPDSLIIAGNRQLVMHRVFQPMLIKGPYPTYDVSGSTSKLIAADQYYTEEFNVTESPINEKGAFVPIEEAAS